MGARATTAGTPVKSSGTPPRRAARRIQPLRDPAPAPRPRPQRTRARSPRPPRPPRPEPEPEPEPNGTPTEICGDIRIETALWGNENTYDIGPRQVPPVCARETVPAVHSATTRPTYSACWTPASCQFYALTAADGWHGGTYRIRTLMARLTSSSPPSGYKGEYVDLP